MNLIEWLLQNGGIMVYPLGLCSLFAVFTCCYKIFALRASRIYPNLVEQKWQVWFTQPNNTLPTDSSLLSSALKNLVLIKDINVWQQKLEYELRQSHHRLSRGLVILETVSSIAPLLGLLGTVLGMVKVFVSLVEDSKVQLSTGISEALGTTLIGLFIGIPALIAYNLLDQQVENLVFGLESKVRKLAQNMNPK